MGLVEKPYSIILSTNCTNITSKSDNRISSPSSSSAKRQFTGEQVSLLEYHNVQQLVICINQLPATLASSLSNGRPADDSSFCSCSFTTRGLFPPAVLRKDFCERCDPPIAASTCINNKSHDRKESQKTSQNK